LSRWFPANRSAPRAQSANPYRRRGQRTRVSPIILMPNNNRHDKEPKDLSTPVQIAEDEQELRIEAPVSAPAAESPLKIPDELPILPLRGLVVLPQTAIPLTVGQPRSIKLIDDVVTSDPRLLGLISARDPDLETPGPDDIYTIGTLASILRLFRAPDGTIRLLVQGVGRIRVEQFTNQDPYLKAKVVA